MINGINNIRLEGLFTGILQKHLMTFRTGKLPKDIHFTLVFDENLADINLHITRNVKGATKPKIGIVKVNRRVVSDLAEELSLRMFYSLMEPIQMKVFLNDKDSVGFISFDDAEKSGVSQRIYDSWLEPLKAYTKVKGKRLTVSGQYRKAFDNTIRNQLECHQEIFDLLKPIADKYKKEIESGIIIADNECYFAARFHEQWYFFKSNLTMFDFLSGLTDRKTAYFIICKIEHALEIILTAESYEQTKIYDKPLRLEALKP